MVDSQQHKGYRVISMFDRLMDGQGINKNKKHLHIMLVKNHTTGFE